MDIEKNIGKDFSGVISVVEKDKIIYQKAFGYRDRANEIPNTVDTRFETASAGKAFVAAAILKLIEEGSLNFETALGDVLDFDLQGIDKNVTVYELLTHTSGIPDYFDEYVMENYEDLWVEVPNYRIRTSKDLLPLFIDKPMMYERGDKFQYNNSGYVMLGLLIEALKKVPFDVYLQEKIFDPAGMKDTGYFEMDRLPARCAYAYIYDGERGDYRNNIYSVDVKGTGAGGAFTTAEDVEKFWKALSSGKIISKEMFHEMKKPQGKASFYGYGLWILDSDTPCFQGSDPGVNFYTSFDLKEERIITILSNVEYDAETLHDHIRNELRK